MQRGLRFAAAFFFLAAVLWALGATSTLVLTAASIGLVCVASTWVLVFVDWVRKR